MHIEYNPEISWFFGDTTEDLEASDNKREWLAIQRQKLEHLQELMRLRGVQWDYTVEPREGRGGEGIFWFSGYTEPAADGTRIRAIGWCSAEELLSDYFPPRRVRVEPRTGVGEKPHAA